MFNQITAVFKYADVEQIKHEWMEQESEKNGRVRQTEQGKAAWVITQADFNQNFLLNEKQRATEAK